MKVALLRNHDRSGVLHKFGQPSPERCSKRTVGNVGDALRAGGHDVDVFEADALLLNRLREWLPATPVPAGDHAGPDALRPDEVPAIAFNLAYGIQGECRYTQLPAMLELAGIPYTGSGPRGHTLALDKVVTKTLAAAAGVSTPAHRVATSPADLTGLRYPLVVKPQHESTSYGLELVHGADRAAAAIDTVVRRYQQPALVEEYIEGREICIALLGNGTGLECLPPVEIRFGARTLRMMTKDDKFHRRDSELTRVCPAPLDHYLLSWIQEVAVATFEACHCRDYARVDIRVDANGVPWMLEINSMASLGLGGSYVMAAQAAGYSFDEIVNRIIAVALQRYAQRPATHASTPESTPTPMAMAVG
jgi:D-alanine-D-alanine ligase